MIANAWAMAGIRRVDERLTAGRFRALSLYWVFVDIIWWIIFVLLYVL